MAAVEEKSFKFKVEEWSYYDKYHNMESINYIVAEEGDYVYSNGIGISIGKFQGNVEEKAVFYPTPLSDNVIILAQPQTYKWNEAL